MIQRRRGAAMVEMALVMPLLVLLLLGIVEFGMIMHDKVMLDHAVSDGARAAAMGQTVDQIKADVAQAAPDLHISQDRVQIQSGTDPANSNSWLAVGDTTDASGNRINDAPSGSMVQVKITGYPHQLVTGSFFAWLPDCQNGSLPLTASLVTRRQ